jgi:hypothetical protein
MRILSLAGLVAFLMLALTACKEEKTPEEILCEQKMYQPFSVEHYELRTFPDTSIVVYFNREVTENDILLNCFYEITKDSVKHDLLQANILLPLRKSKNRMLIYKLPLNNLQIDSLNTTASVVDFNLMIEEYLREDYHKVFVQVKAGFPNVPAASFLPDKRFYPPWVFLRFNEKENIAAREKMCILEREKSNLWGLDLLRYYKGQFDSTGRKQGYWRWHYSTGTIMAEGNFKDDTLCSDLKLYNFKGKYYHAISAKYINEQYRFLKSFYWQNQ